MWLVQHKRILTWENLRKRGLVGPSRFQLCGLQEEMMDHLLNLCPFTSTLWNWVTSIFRQTDRDEYSITDTLKNWRKDFSENEIINKNQTLIPGFSIWDVQKECNNRIFKNKIGSTKSIIAQITRQLKETISPLLKKPPENRPLREEAQILFPLGLQLPAPQSISRIVRHITMGKDFQKPPPQGFLKFNIDEASKGNLGGTSYDGVIRDEQGYIKFIFHSHLGKATNNMVELMALDQCLEMLINSDLHNAIIEADFELIINSFKKIENGTTPEKVSKHWRLLQVCQQIQSQLKTLRTLIYVHVRRTAKRLVDCLANEGVLCTRNNRRYAWELTPSTNLREDYNRQVIEDTKHYQAMKDKQ